jgi:hypothetical protein
MQDMIGSAGMLRGWVTMWTMHMVWFAAMMTVTVGATAVLELLFNGHARRARAALLAQAAATDAKELERPRV